MGYTHYIDQNKDFTDEQWALIKEAYQKIISHCIGKGIQIDDASTDSTIMFNGVEDDGHEDFQIVKSNGGREFCKTNQKPYDLAICLLLTYIKSVAGDCITITSDGSWTEWACKKDYEVIFRGKPKNPISKK